MPAKKNKKKNSQPKAIVVLTTDVEKPEETEESSYLTAVENQ